MAHQNQHSTQNRPEHRQERQCQMKSGTQFTERGSRIVMPGGTAHKEWHTTHYEGPAACHTGAQMLHQEWHMPLHLHSAFASRGPTCILRSHATAPYHLMHQTTPAPRPKHLRWDHTMRNPKPFIADRDQAQRNGSNPTPSFNNIQNQILLAVSRTAIQVQTARRTAQPMAIFN